MVTSESVLQHNRKIDSNCSKSRNRWEKCRTDWEFGENKDVSNFQSKCPSPMCVGNKREKNRRSAIHREKTKKETFKWQFLFLGVLGFHHVRPIQTGRNRLRLCGRSCRRERQKWGTPCPSGRTAREWGHFLHRFHFERVQRQHPHVTCHRSCCPLERRECARGNAKFGKHSTGAGPDPTTDRKITTQCCQRRRGVENFRLGPPILRRAAHIT
jgi:hypothetical protein